MSSTAIAWVWEHSPLTGAGFVVHLALGDVANDMHNDELWVSLPTLARKARVSRATAKRAVDELVDAGMLEVLAERPGSTTLYRFVFVDDAPVVFSMRRRATPITTRGVDAEPPLSPREGYPARGEQGAARDARGTPITTRGHNTMERKTNENDEHQPALVVVDASSSEMVRVDPFDEFWATYPRRTAKADARKAWDRHVAKAKIDPADVIAAAARYRDDPNRVDKFTAHPATWLNGGRWMDEQPLPARHGHEGRGGIAANADRLARMAERASAT